MDWYHIWCDLKTGEDDLAFCRNVDGYLGHLKENGLIEEHRLMRRKLGLAHDGAREFHIMIGTRAWPNSTPPLTSSRRAPARSKPCTKRSTAR